ncbi:reverse transcriptase [Phytophthora megakarya]|uniref:Reverse transcriptase n=1 Tax=Phytophthora megakarya TaxID=4795 RepID=A0A225UGC2_9STRA|nr:reverse transcriptase [Phytophthora megakarya]
MSDFFRAFFKILDQRQRATMAYRPQANGSAERMVQTTTRALKMYVQDLDQRDWDEHYQQAREQVNQRLREAISDRADQHNDIVRPHQVEVGSRVWLYLDRVREGYAKKLAHLKTRYGRILREFLVHWRGYEDPTWIDEADLNCGAILHEFLRDRANQNRFGVMQSHEDT